MIATTGILQAGIEFAPVPKRLRLLACGMPLRWSGGSRQEGCGRAAGAGSACFRPGLEGGAPTLIARQVDPDLEIVCDGLA